VDITAKQIGSTTVVSIVGSVDALTAEQVTRFMNAELGKGNKQIVGDLSQVDFISSAGLRAILVTLKDSRQQGGDLRLAAAQTGVEKVLKMSGFTNILKTYPTVDEAVASFGA